MPGFFVALSAAGICLVLALLARGYPVAVLLPVAVLGLCLSVINMILKTAMDPDGAELWTDADEEAFQNHLANSQEEELLIL